jgi:hypothetical protein
MTCICHQRGGGGSGGRGVRDLAVLHRALHLLAGSELRRAGCDVNLHAAAAAAAAAATAAVTLAALYNYTSDFENKRHHRHVLLKQAVEVLVVSIVGSFEF